MSGGKQMYKVGSDSLETKELKRKKGRCVQEPRICSFPFSWLSHNENKAQQFFISFTMTSS